MSDRWAGQPIFLPPVVTYNICWGLHLEVYTQEEAAWHHWTINIHRIAECTSVDVALEAVEDILYTAKYLHRYSLCKLHIVGYAYSHIPKAWCNLVAVGFDVAGTMWHKHMACEVTKERCFEVACKVGRCCEVAVVVGCAEHSALSLDTLTPLLRLIITTALECVTHLQLKDVGDTKFQLGGEALNLCSGGVVASLDYVSSLVFARLSQCKYIVENGVESLDKQVGLQRAEVVVEVS